MTWPIPWLIGRLPEPREAPDRPAGEEPKRLYAEVAATPHLGWTSLAAVLAVMASLGIVLPAAHHGIWVWVALIPVCWVCVALAIIDWQTRLLPKALVLPATGYTLLVLLGEAAITGEWPRLLWAVVAGLVTRAFYWLFWFVRSAGIGFGDVRLAGLLGLILGRIGWNAWVLGIYGGFVVFAVYALVRAAVRRDRGFLRRHLPYGPFMLLGAWLGVLLAPVIPLID